MNLRNVQAIGITFLIVILVACNGSFSSSPVSTTATSSYTQFAEVRFWDSGPGSRCSWDAQKNGDASFTFPGIYAIDRNTSFLFGALHTQGGMRSLLLRSDDGGISWEETMPPVLNYIVFSVSFVDSEQGWAAIVYGVESPGNIVLYKSRDGGRHWSEFASIDVGALGYGVGSPIAMVFQNKQDGKIVIGFEEHFSILHTEDGGTTWQETEQIPLPISVDLDTTGSRGVDWSEWSLETIEDGTNPTIKVSRQPLGESIMVVGYLSVSYKIENGCIVQ